MEEDRPFESWVGVVRNPRVDAGGIFGDIELRTKGPHYNQIIEAAERFADHFGCSHVADGKSRLDNGEEVIESITHVFSVDLVCEPATTKGLAESTNGAAISTDPILQAIDHYLGADGDRETLVAFLKDILETMVEKADQIADGKAGTAHLPPSAESFAAFWPKPISREESERFAQSLR
ncbi:MAG: hypothetical protein IT425_02650 [Pirellulales bacterium]|nr:hypothetical protein [Pirellulales bacterium]